MYIIIYLLWVFIRVACCSQAKEYLMLYFGSKISHKGPYIKHFVILLAGKTLKTGPRVLAIEAQISESWC